MRRINVTKASTSDVNNLAVRQNARRPIRHIAYRNTTTHHAVHKLSRRRCRQPFIHRPAFVGLKMSEGKPAQPLKWHNPGDGSGNQWKHFSLPAVKQERLITGDQEVIKSEACRGSDFGHEDG